MKPWLNLGITAPPEGAGLPKDIIEAAERVPSAAVPILSDISNNSRMNLVPNAKLLSKQVREMIRTAKAATEHAPPDQRAQLGLEIEHATAAVKEFLNRAGAYFSDDSPTRGQKGPAVEAARSITTTINDLSAYVSNLVPEGYIDPNDPTYIAEQELLAAAKSIEAAAKKLEMLRPIEPVREANQTLKFEDQIFEAAKNIAAATRALVQSATTVQREIVANEKNQQRAGKKYHADPRWQEGLVSAAKAVAAATGDLCEAANAAVKGQTDRERVIAAAKAVSASTIQLITASRPARANDKSKSKLEEAGKTVTDATQKLVKAAETSAVFQPRDENLAPEQENASEAARRREHMEMDIEILRLQKQLEDKRRAKAELYKRDYKKDPKK